MVPFAGYNMPVQYPAGLMAEHHHTRTAAGLFDVSHMGQLTLSGPDAAAAFESLMPVDVIGLGVNKQRYGLLLTDEGGIIDDLMFVNRNIANAKCSGRGAPSALTSMSKSERWTPVTSNARRASRSSPRTRRSTTTGRRPLQRGTRRA